MAGYVVVIFFCALSLGQGVLGSFLLNATPTDILSGLTSSLRINCTFSYGSFPNVSSLLSLIISKAELNSSVPQKFEEVLAINAFAPNHVNELFHVNASIEGHISASGESYLDIQWKYPTWKDSGLYRCDANVLDSIGHPVDISMTTKVTAHQPELADLIIKFAELEAHSETQTETIALLQSEIAFLETKMESQEKKQSETIARLQSDLSLYAKEKSDMMAAIFEISGNYNGRIYLLSKQPWVNADVAEAICEHHDGYLAEINDSSEHQFIKDFLNQFANTTRVLLGGTDEGKEANWIFRFSRQPVVYTNWGDNEPNSIPYDCMLIYRPSAWKMFDYPCYNHEGEPGKQFLCEVPTN